MAIYDQGLEKNPANFTALTPLSFLPKAAAYPNRPLRTNYICLRQFP